MPLQRSHTYRRQVNSTDDERVSCRLTTSCPQERVLPVVDKPCVFKPSAAGLVRVREDHWTVEHQFIVATRRLRSDWD